MRRLAVAGMLAMGFGLAACSMQPAEFPTPQSEMGTGPGLLSGKSGEFTVYRQPE